MENSPYHEDATSPRVSTMRARLAVFVAKGIARLPVNAIVRFLKAFTVLQKTPSREDAYIVDAKVREVSPLCRGERGCLARSISIYLMDFWIPRETLPCTCLGYC